MALVTTIGWILPLLVVVAGSSDYHSSNCAQNRVAIVHLFEWTWKSIADECENFLGPMGYCGVQISPPNEHVMVTREAMRPWWERYQPVSYKLTSRSGTEEEFIDMVQRCNRANVRIYADLVVNHMSGKGRSGVGTAGSNFNADNNDFPGVPFSDADFNGRDKCNSGSGSIENYGDANQVRNCMLVGLTDLDQSKEYVREKIVGFLNRLINIGVAGFRVDAAKHMWPQDLKIIFDRMDNLNTEFFPAGGRPFVFLEVIDMSNEPIKGQDYTHMGRVTEFRYCIKIRELVGQMGNLRGVYDPGWGMLPPGDAFVFVDNHDNQRGHGASGNVLSFKDPRNYKLGVAFTLAYTYGFPRIMSSYEFENDKQGPPHHGDYSTKHVVVNPDGTSCAEGWVCEHRWRVMAGMASFSKAVSGTGMENWWNVGNSIAFSRGNKGFVAMTQEGGLSASIYTGLPAGQYCNVITGCPTNSGCAGETVTVDNSGNAEIKINSYDDPVLAIHIEAMAGSGGCVSGSEGPPVPPTPRPGETPATSAVTADVGSTLPATAPTGYQRTVILMKRQTSVGQDLFIRGGISHDRRAGCSTVASSSPCAIPIQHNDLGSSRHYDAYNAWRVGDTKLDWYGGEPGQGSYNGKQAEGTPGAWTSSDPSHAGYQPLNTYGDHYWMIDIQMDCSQTENGWFEFKGFLTNHGWERDITQVSSCSGSVGGARPYTTNNHMARCGYLNLVEFDSGSCTIENIN